MKRIRLWIEIVLALVLVLGFGSTVFAADHEGGSEEIDVAVVGSAEVSVSVVGDTAVDMALIGDTEVRLAIEGDTSEVGIDIEGDQTQLGVNITGNDSIVTINGVTPFVTYRTSGSKWARDQIKDVVFPWMAEAGDLIALNADDLMNAILLAGRNESGLMAADFLLDVYGDRLANLKSEANSLDSESEDLATRISALEVERKVMDGFLEYQTARYNYETASLNQTAFYNRALMIVGALAAIAFGFLMKARRRR